MGKRTWKKAVPVPLCTSQIWHGLTWAETRVSKMRGRRLTACAMLQPNSKSG
jgi:hypothetical protein